MKKLFAILLFIIIISCNHRTISENYSFHDIEQGIESGIYITSDSIKISFKNISSSKKYLLTSYLNNRFTYNEHLCKKINDTIYISYTPIIEHLGTIKSDVLIVDDIALFKPMQAIYEFQSINPNEEYKLNLQKSKFCNNNCDGFVFYFRFAFYEKIDLFKVKGIEYDKKLRPLLIKDAKKYTIVNLYGN